MATFDTGVLDICVHISLLLLSLFINVIMIATITTTIAVVVIIWKRPSQVLCVLGIHKYENKYVLKWLSPCKYEWKHSLCACYHFADTYRTNDVQVLALRRFRLQLV